jgi:hypothetical protein
VCQLEEAAQGYNKLVEELIRAILLNTKSSFESPGKDSTTQDEFKTQVEKLLKEAVEFRLIFEGHAVDIRKLQERDSQIENIERQVLALSHLLGLYFEKGGDEGLKQDSPSSSQEGESCLEMELKRLNHDTKEPLMRETSEGKIKRRLLNHLVTKKRLVYPAQIARELNIPSAIYVARVFRQLEEEWHVRAVDTHGYRGRKLYEVLESDTFLLTFANKHIS